MQRQVWVQAVEGATFFPAEGACPEAPLPIDRAVVETRVGQASLGIRDKLEGFRL